MDNMPPVNVFVNKDVVKPRICPIMAQGQLANPHRSETNTTQPLLKCLEEKCALWHDYYKRCGMVK